MLQEGAAGGDQASVRPARRRPWWPPTPISADGWRLELTRPLADAWRDDAGLLADTLQMVRSLRLARGWLERSFTWLPVLAAFALALVVGLVAATRLGAGITEPVNRLVAGTEEVTAGRWDVQVPVARRR